MFTGIVEAVGNIARIENNGTDSRFFIITGKLDLMDVALGDSIAVDGVCLTVVSLLENGFWTDVSQESLSLTNLSRATTGCAVNLEKALTPTTRLGGHLVSGHVDGLGTIISCQKEGRSLRFGIQAPDNLAHYIATKGSICVNGVSLTVNAVDKACFFLNIVPHTLEETTLSNAKEGTVVNLEVDLIARYLERLLTGKISVNNSEGITEHFLAEHGFLRS